MGTGEALKTDAGNMHIIHFTLKVIETHLLTFHMSQNGEFLNINFVDDDLSELEIPIELLVKVHLLRCTNAYELTCTTPGGMVTDFNIWDRALSVQEIRDWTTCK